MLRSSRLNRLTYPLCVATVLGGMAMGDEIPESNSSSLPQIEIESAAEGSGMVSENSGEVLVPPLPVSIEEPLTTPIEGSELPPPDADSDPAPSNAPQPLLPSEFAREVPLASPAAAKPAPIRTRVADPLAELKAQQEAIRRHDQRMASRPEELNLPSIVAPGSEPLLPIDDEESFQVDLETAEVVTQRFPDGSVKLAYQVVRDANDNYVKHGDWKLYNLNGDVVAQGEYRNNERHGHWRRWHNGADAKLFLSSPYTQFTPPYYSEVTFSHDKMDGAWTISDAASRKISEINFRDGLRHGKASWWHANGTVMQEIDFVDGEIHGDLKVWTSEGNLLAAHVFKHGRRDAPVVTKYPNGQKKSEGAVLEARTFITEPDDWWTATTAVFTKEGMDQKHGLWRQWHPNGTLHVEGTYENHVQHGKFTWWYSTGQKALAGHYREGQRDGQWCWWHANGQKQAEGTFAADEAIASWIWWNEDGSVARRADAKENNPASRTAEGKGSKVKPTAFDSTNSTPAEPQLLPIPATIR